MVSGSKVVSRSGSKKPRLASAKTDGSECDVIVGVDDIDVSVFGGYC